jgi:hypothetical protein
MLVRLTAGLGSDFASRIAPSAAPSPLLSGSPLTGLSAALHSDFAVQIGPSATGLPLVVKRVV